MLDVAVEHMGKSPQEARHSRNESQQIGNAGAGQLAVERAADGFFSRRVDQFPTSLFGTAGDLDVFVCTVGNTLIDLCKSSFHRFTERAQRVLNRGYEEGCANLLQDGLVLLPARVADQVIFEAAKLIAILDEQVSCFQGVPQQSIDEKLVTIDLQSLALILRIAGSVAFGEEVALQALRDHRRGKLHRLGLSRRLARAQQLLKKRDCIQQRRILYPTGEV